MACKCAVKITFYFQFFSGKQSTETSRQRFFTAEDAAVATSFLGIKHGPVIRPMAAGLNKYGTIDSQVIMQ